jgi:ribosome maturation protein SDO1
MSRQITQPVGQVRLTNVAVVRLNRTGKRFEVACYRNKVVNWRNRVETDLTEVLQIASVFQNVSKGVLANKTDIVKAFGTDNEDEVIRYILDKGEMQVSDKERKAQYESLFRDVATIISEKCVDPTSNRPYTVSMIENAMRDVHFSVHPTKAAKAQALELIGKLKEVMPIARASMKLRVSSEAPQGEAVKAALQALTVTSFEDETWTGGGGSDEYSASILVDPGLFRGVEEAVRASTGGRGRVEVLQMSVQQEGDADIDLEAARKGMMALKVQQQAAAAAAAAGSDDDSDSGAQQLELMPAASKRGGSSSSVKQQQQQQQQQQGDSDSEQSSKAPAKAQPKSKKAKRKEKEAAAEREQRAAATAQRQAERQADRPQKSDTGFTVLDSSEAAAAASAKEISDAAAAASSTSRLKCNTCAVAFADTEAYREHFKSDWHRYNLKLKMKKLPAVSADEFKTVDAENFFFEDR